jgi:hypothetical protein
MVTSVTAVARDIVEHLLANTEAAYGENSSVRRTLRERRRYHPYWPHHQ